MGHSRDKVYEMMEYLCQGCPEDSSKAALDVESTIDGEITIDSDEIRFKNFRNKLEKILGFSEIENENPENQLFTPSQ